MLEQEFTIVNALGLHARAASQFVRLASRFESQIKLQKDAQTVDAKSIMGVMLLAAGQGSLIRLSIEGEDEQEAMQKLAELIERGFGEA